eukprot:gb/GECG01009063.1/.p1 GENE.gb/GECG01009063.1/~~gb/GECG01009063.1/.p1  ORF type:complete len:120 (+),score=8.60 gb/GECG01009063.1/:1-360(+)
MKKPLLAIPINLSVAMQLRKGTAFIGFTSSTGSAWERHDINSWYFCEDVSLAPHPLTPQGSFSEQSLNQATCERKGLSDEVLAQEFDYREDGFFTPFFDEAVRRSSHRQVGSTNIYFWH